MILFIVLLLIMINIAGNLGCSNRSILTTILKVKSSNAVAENAHSYFFKLFGQNESFKHI